MVDMIHTYLISSLRLRGLAKAGVSAASCRLPARAAWLLRLRGCRCCSVCSPKLVLNGLTGAGLL